MTNEQTIDAVRRHCNKIGAEFAQIKQIVEALAESDNTEEVEFLRAENKRLRAEIRKYELESWMNKHK